MFLAGKRALITGSTSGIGLAIARALKGEGAEVVLNGFGDADEIAKLCVELDAMHIGADLTRREGCEELMEATGPVDILVNNAGMQHVAPIEDFPPDKWDAIIALNLTSAFHTARLAGRQFHPIQHNDLGHRNIDDTGGFKQLGNARQVGYRCLATHHMHHCQHGVCLAATKGRLELDYGVATLARQALRH